MCTLVVDTRLKSLVVDTRVKSLVVDTRVKSLVVDATLKSLVVDARLKSLVVDARLKSLVVECYRLKSREFCLMIMIVIMIIQTLYQKFTDVVIPPFIVDSTWCHLE